jgi:hypothetical protein
MHEVENLAKTTLYVERNLPKTLPSPQRERGWG